MPEHIWKFVIENPATVAGWIVAFLSGALAAPYVAHWLRRREEKRGDHLLEFQREVLQPMLLFLDKHALPVLRHEAGNVDVCIRQIPNPPELMERPSFEQVICVRMVTEPFQEHTFGMGVLAPLQVPEGRLMEDARRHHFPDLFRKWDMVIARFREYNDACLQYAEALRARIVEENSLLPEFTLRSDGPGPE